MNTPKLNPSALRAATYARYSSAQQRDTSLTDQQRNCHTRAAREGWTIVHDYADAAISGSDSTRPQYLEMIAAARRHEFDVLILDDLSRLTRDSMEQEKTLRTLEFVGGCNVRIVSVSDGYDSQQHSRKLHRAMKGAMNEAFIDDLRAKVHRGQTGQALKKYWNGGRPFGYKLKAITDATRTDAYGAPARVGTVLVVDVAQAKIVKEIFERYVAGESYVAIASDLNQRKVASAGSTWKRVKRRCSGWVGSSVRGMLINPLYCGAQRWNASQFVKNPDTGKHLRRKRAESEWVVNQIESLRIVSDAVFARAQARIQKLAEPDVRHRQGGQRKYLLTGLLRCSMCDGPYEMADGLSYACASFKNGGSAACSNNVRVNRKSIEGTLIGPILQELRDPVRVAKIAKEMQAAFAERMRERAARTSAVPSELAALDARLLSLSTMEGLTDDERHLLVEKAQSKRRELQAQQPIAKQQAQILTMLPVAASAYLKQIEAGLLGDVRAASKGRLILQDLIGPVSLQPGDYGSLWATYTQNLWALVRARTGTTGLCGRGDRI
jgi:site-specific DNA recombinase